MRLDLRDKTRASGLRRLPPCAVLGLIFSAMPVQSAVRENGTYCLYPRAGGLLIFAQRARPDGDLDFIISLWADTGSYEGYSGTAKRIDSGHWTHESDMDAPDPRNRCRIHIALLPDGGFAANGDAQAVCAEASRGVPMNRLEFPASSYEGLVTDGEFESPGNAGLACDDSKQHRPKG